jgi:hypothetical protein
VSVPVYSDHVESRLSVRVSRLPAEIHFCGSAELSPLNVVDCLNGGYEPIAGAVTDLHEHNALGVQHNEVNLAQTAAKIAFDSAQAPRFEVP